ncbi:hypothetical protein OKW50_002155 [Paraburkholderia youngii]
MTMAGTGAGSTVITGTMTTDLAGHSMVGSSHPWQQKALAQKDRQGFAHLRVCFIY